MNKTLVVVLFLFLLSFSFAQEKNLSAEEFREKLQECKDFEDLVKSRSYCSFTEEELANPNGDDSISEKREETIKKLYDCLELNILYADSMYSKEEISKEEYDDVRGFGDYTFGRLGSSSLLNHCAYNDCKAVVNYYYQSARNAIDLDEKIRLYDKALELYFECLKLSTSALIDSYAFPTGLGRMGERDDFLNKIGADCYLEKCNTKIQKIKREIEAELSSGNNPARLSELYEELMEVIGECSKMAFSALSDPQSDFAEFISILYVSGREGDYAVQFKDAFINKCKYKLQDLRNKIENATGTEKAELEREFAEEFLKCFKESNDVILSIHEEVNPFDFIDLTPEERDLIKKTCLEEIKELQAEKQKPLEERSTGYSSYWIDQLIERLKQECNITDLITEKPKDVSLIKNGDEFIYLNEEGEPIGYSNQRIQEIINRAPERFSDSAGIYTLTESDKDAVIADTGKEIFVAENYSESEPSPASFVQAGHGMDIALNAVDTAKESIEETIRDFVSEPESSECEENWECSEWSEWNWSKCKPNHMKEADRNRSCIDLNECGTENDKPEETETKSTECLYIPPDLFVIVDGQDSNLFVLNYNRDINVRIDAGIRELDFPIKLKLDGTVDIPGTDYVIEWTPSKSLILHCKSRSQCEVQTDWGPAINQTQAAGDYVVEAVIGENEDFIIEFPFTVSLGTDSECTENWECTPWSSWSECSENIQTRTRTCTDLNDCNTTLNKPQETESQSCETECIESWQCTEWVSWSEWQECQENNTQIRIRTRACYDENNCGTTEFKPNETDTESRECDYVPTQQKPEYTAHENALGEKIADLNYSGDFVEFDLSLTGGEYGYRILGIPPSATIEVCVAAVEPLSFYYYPRFHYGFDFIDTSPGCTEIYNKNAWANGVLMHLGDPTPVETAGQITVTQK
jgi:hypothetical protein